MGHGIYVSYSGKGKVAFPMVCMYAGSSTAEWPYKYIIQTNPNS